MPFFSWYRLALIASPIRRYSSIRSAEASSSCCIASFRWQRSIWLFSIRTMAALFWFSLSRASRLPK